MAITTRKVSGSVACLGDGIIDYHWVWDQVEALGYDRDYALEFEVGDIEPVETGYRKWYETWERA